MVVVEYEYVSTGARLELVQEHGQRDVHRLHTRRAKRLQRGRTNAVLA